MGLFQALIGNASQKDTEKAREEYARLLAPDEELEAAYQLIRNVFMFTSRRLIIVDKQGMTGKKTEYTSIPYKSVTRFSVETAGHFELDAELNIWITGVAQPLQFTFGRSVNVYEVQAMLAAAVG